jgi:hydroxymethylglutaryl-CoA lyase
VHPVKIIECPRDAMQGLKHVITTDKKVQYLKQLLQCGFDTLDCGSFVNPAAVPQMADTAEVLELLGRDFKNTKLLVIVANERGAVRAASFPQVSYLGFPFSLNETFQRRNTNSGKDDAFIKLLKINEIAKAAGKKTVAYISMAFGNPYEEPYNRNEVLEWALKMAAEGIEIISLADTVGNAAETDIDYLFKLLGKEIPHVELGAHFHAKPHEWLAKIKPAWNSGCRRFDGAMLGFGGCPFAKDDLTGNIPTEHLVQWLNTVTETGIDQAALAVAQNLASITYSH